MLASTLIAGRARTWHRVSHDRTAHMCVNSCSHNHILGKAACFVIPATFLCSKLGGNIFARQNPIADRPNIWSSHTQCFCHGMKIGPAGVDEHVLQPHRGDHGPNESRHIAMSDRGIVPPFRPPVPRPQIQICPQRALIEWYWYASHVLYHPFCFLYVPLLLPCSF